ncbi:MAG: GlsB/YeaQ/YmgE family stress response membrane protein [Candidatus Binatia bacterium]
MNGILWVVLGAITGWLTGKLIGEKGYGELLKAGYARGLDMVFGIVGASLGGYLFFWAVIGEGSAFSKYATAVLGSITLVGLVRQFSARYLPFNLTSGKPISY